MLGRCLLSTCTGISTVSSTVVLCSCIAVVPLQQSVVRATAAVQYYCTVLQQNSSTENEKLHRLVRHMPVRCVYQCRHPLWGGDGTCIVNSDPTADAACACDAGYVSRDGAGYPSCVPKVALVTGYAILGVSGLVTAAFLLLHAIRYRYLPQQNRSTRKAAIRIRALVSGRWVQRRRRKRIYAVCEPCPRSMLNIPYVQQYGPSHWGTGMKLAQASFLMRVTVYTSDT